jgi:hypothetical protein
MLRARLFGTALGMGGLLLVALNGNGQEKLGLAGEGDSLRAALLRSAEIQKELKLSTKQIEKITAVAQEAKASKKKVEGAHGKGKGREKGKAKGDDPVAKEQEAVAKEAMRGDFTILERETDQQINSILDSRQRTRLRQIVFQADGLSVLNRPDVIRALQLVDDQLGQIQAMLLGLVDESRQLREEMKGEAPPVEPGDREQEEARKEQEKSRLRSGSSELNQRVRM